MLCVLLASFNIYALESIRTVDVSMKNQLMSGCNSNDDGLSENIKKEDIQKLCEQLKDKSSCLKGSINRHDQPPDGGEKIKICDWNAPRSKKSFIIK